MLSPQHNKYGFQNLFTYNSYSPTMPYNTQIHPAAWGFVQEYVRKRGNELESMKGWALPYFNMMDAILLQYGIPREMKYLAVIESHLNAGTVSWAGAVGPWQFMPETGRTYGLHVNGYVDERRNYYKSTHAAARYLTDLYKEFGDWLLVIAAYNCGSGGVISAIRRSGSRNFWQLQNYLPAESRNHVKKFIGTHYIFEGRGGITTTGKQDLIRNAELQEAPGAVLSEADKLNTETLKLSGRYNSMVIAKVIAMDIGEFNRLNPGFDAGIGGESASYEMRLPKDKLELFKAKRMQILNESVQVLLGSVADPVMPPVKQVKKKRGF